MEPSRQPSVVRFGTYELGLQSGELRKAGARVRVQQQPLKLLEILLERPGAVVSRDELRNRIWPDESYGDFDQAVNVAIAKLRAALGDSADNPRYVETLPRRGYRFIADVSVVAPATDNANLSLPIEDPARVDREGASSPANSKSILLRYAWGVLGLAVLLPVLAWGGWVFFRGGKAPVPASSTPIHSLAVLPLENLSSDSEDYFADGMTDELITDLAQISALRVISRTSIMPYKGIRKPLSQIAHELGVDAVVEGTVLRSGKQVRITAQLIRAPDDNHLWAQSYEGDVRDTLALQKRVARTIAEQIRITLTPRDSAALESMSSTPSPGATWLVCARGCAFQTVQAALNDAACGDVIELAAGETFSGAGLRFPAKGCDNAHWITVRTSTPDNLLPREGARMPDSTECEMQRGEFDGRGFIVGVIAVKSIASYEHVGTASMNRWRRRLVSQTRSFRREPRHSTGSRPRGIVGELSSQSPP